MMGAIQKERLRNELDIPDHLMIRLALGKPAETLVLENLEPGGDIRYWRDQKDINHVPKRKLEEIILK